MMFRIIFVAFLSFTTTFTTAQIAPYGIELDTLKALIKDKPDFYTDLCEAFLENDTSLTASHYLIIYYGSAYMEGYAPYSEQMVKSSVRKLIKEEKFQEAIELGEGIAKKYPAMAGIYYDLGVAYDKNGNEEMSKINFEKYRSIMFIPFFSGTGKSTDSAYVVRSVNDEYLIMMELGLDVQGQSLISGDNGIPYDVLKGVPYNDETAEPINVYFNIYQPFKLGMNLFSDDKTSSKEEDTNEKSTNRKKRKKKRKSKD